jgi:hypothetical protein
LSGWINIVQVLDAFSEVLRPFVIGKPAGSREREVRAWELKTKPPETAERAEAKHAHSFFDDDLTMLRMSLSRSPAS